MGKVDFRTVKAKNLRNPRDRVMGSFANIFENL